MLGGRRKIVLVDDDPVILKLARNSLMSNYDVFTAPSAERLFLFLEKVLPDLILMDVLMPEISGYEAVKSLKADRRTAGIPVIFLTSQTDPNDEWEGLDLGAVDYVRKPFSPQLLQKRIDVHMLAVSQNRELQQWNENLKETVRETTGVVSELQNAILKTMANLVEYRDDVTGGHIERTEQFLRLLVGALQRDGIYDDVLCGWGRELFFQSALLHDVGKIAIRDDILLKPGKLTDQEFEEMKKHTTFGEAIIEKIQLTTPGSMFLAHAKVMAGSHHEKWDGTGYPRGLAGAGIPLQGRLMAIVDVYDALISERPYKKAMSPEEAARVILRESGRHFDPALTRVFTEATRLFDRCA